MQIIFYAPLGRNVPPEMRGGAEAGCNKTLSIYREHGYDVIISEKAAKTGGKCSYLLKTMGAYARYVWQCLRHRRAMVHVVGFYGKVIKMEHLLVLTAKALGHKVAYEMRNGGMVDMYKSGTPSYQSLQRQLWQEADGLLCQGMKFVDFIKETMGIDAFYYPNYIQRSSLPKAENRYDPNSLNLVFFGRLVPAKNINLIIETASLLQKRGAPVHLDLIGGISEDYRAELESLMDRLGMDKGAVRFHGHRDFRYISEVLEKAHFFIFPSAEPNEGHSNSLTEAMGSGVVPIVSTAGFNESICADPDLVVRSLNAEDYAQRILSIWNPAAWAEKQKQCLRRIAGAYTHDVVGDRLCAYMEGISKGINK